MSHLFQKSDPIVLGHISSYTVREWFTFLPEFLITAGLFLRTRVCPQRMLLRFCFLSFLCVAADLYPIDIVHQYLLHHRRSKQKDFLPPALPVVTLSLRLPMPSKPAPAAGMGKAGRHHVRHTAGNRRDAFFQFTPRVHWRNWSYRTLSHNRLPAEDQASQLPQLIMSFRNSLRIQVSISALTAIIDGFLAKSP